MSGSGVRNSRSAADAAATIRVVLAVISLPLPGEDALAVQPHPLSDSARVRTIRHQMT